MHCKIVWSTLTLKRQTFKSLGFIVISLIVLFLIARLRDFIVLSFEQRNIFSYCPMWPSQIDMQCIFEEQKNQKHFNDKWMACFSKAHQNFERSEFDDTSVDLEKLYDFIGLKFRFQYIRRRSDSQWLLIISHTWSSLRCLHIKAFERANLNWTTSYLVSDNINLCIFKWINTWAQLCN